MRLGQRPWPCTRLAELAERLDADGATAIAFDVVFAEPDEHFSQEAPIRSFATEISTPNCSHQITTLV